MKVIVCRVGHRAVVEDIDTSLEALQNVVGGLIECNYNFFYDDVVIVADEESKLGAKEQNRILVNDGRIVDIVYGDFFLCGAGDEEFADMPEDKIEKYLHLMNASSVYWLNKRLNDVISQYEPEKVEETAESIA